MFLCSDGSNSIFSWGRDLAFSLFHLLIEIQSDTDRLQKSQLVIAPGLLLPTEEMATTSQIPVAWLSAASAYTLQSLSVTICHIVL